MDILGHKDQWLPGVGAGDREEQADDRGFLGQQNTLYDSGGYTSSRICPNPQNVPHQE